MLLHVFGVVVWVGSGEVDLVDYGRCQVVPLVEVPRNEYHSVVGGSDIYTGLQFVGLGDGGVDLRTEFLDRQNNSGFVVTSEGCVTDVSLLNILCVCEYGVFRSGVLVVD